MPRTFNGESSFYALRHDVRIYYFSSIKISLSPPAIKLFPFISEGFDQDHSHSGAASI